LTSSDQKIHLFYHQRQTPNKLLENQFMAKHKYNAYRRNRNRNPSREGQLRAVAHRLGMDFIQQEEYSVTREVSDFELFQKGRNRLATNIMQKSEGCHNL